jgi:acyl-CoA reductase-like NAD-dependent aldehyde dehydrogenase
MMADTNSIYQRVQQQRQFFATGQTRDLGFRRQQLQRLLQMITENRRLILDAVIADLGRPELEANFEMASLTEINYAIKQLKSWAKPKKVPVSPAQFPASARVYPEPLGVVLIIGPWNYPFQLMTTPLVGAIAAGNCAILKPSELAVETSKLITNLIQKTFDPAYIAAVEGGVETAQTLLDQKFDHIFFTGGTKVGQVVMEAAAKQLTPVTLELGGKSPCIIDHEVDIQVAAKRIVWGKFLNAGQTCIAPDYLLVDQSIKSELLTALQQTIHDFYGENPQESPDYARMISPKHWQRLTQFLDKGNIVTGGQTNLEEKYIAPTIIDGVSWEDPVMQDEIFGPILPILEYQSLEKAIAQVNERPKPLALYFFSTNSAKQQQVLQGTSSGGVLFNDTVLHVGSQFLPFGGVGNSGIGSYHGKASFDTFSHYKSVLKKTFRFDIPFRYPPYLKKLKFMEFLVSR